MTPGQKQNPILMPEVSATLLLRVPKKSHSRNPCS